MFTNTFVLIALATQSMQHVPDVSLLAMHTRCCHHKMFLLNIVECDAGLCKSCLVDSDDACVNLSCNNDASQTICLIKIVFLTLYRKIASFTVGLATVANYTVSCKKTHAIFFYYNLGYCGQIFKVLSLTYFKVNSVCAHS